MNKPVSKNYRAVGRLLSALATLALAGFTLMASPQNAAAQSETRIISVAPELVFGKVEIGNLKLQLLIVTNSGNSTLTISNITLPDGFVFSLDGPESNSISGTIGPGAWTNFLLFFSPTNIGNYSNTVIINSDATSGTGEFTVSGEAEYPTGRYLGLFYPPLNASADNSGQFSANATSRGAVSAVLQLAGKRYPFSGRFSPSGAFSAELTNGLFVSFQVISGAILWEGTVSNGTWVANLSANSAKASPKPTDELKPGSYQIAIAGSPIPELGPTNDGSATIRISGSQAVHLSGTLGDGTIFSQGTTLCRGSQVPFYSSLYGGKGGVLGWINSFLVQTNLPTPASPQILGTNDIFGLLAWFKPPGIDSNYPSGFSFLTTVSGPVP